MDGRRFMHFTDMIRGKLFTRTDMFQWLQGKSPEPPLSDFERLQACLSFTLPPGAHICFWEPYPF